MKQTLIFLLCFAMTLFCVAQNSLTIQYDYDEAGNCVLRKVINLPPPLLAPPDSTLTEITEPESPQSPDLSIIQSFNPSIPQSLNPEFFLEKIAQVEIKIYPNPTTEKITLEISNMENLQSGIFKLYSLNGQLLKEQPVHSSTTEVSLAGMARGTYILKVNINGHTEDWKVIKQ